MRLGRLPGADRANRHRIARQACFVLGTKFAPAAARTSGWCYQTHRQVAVQAVDREGKVVAQDPKSSHAASLHSQLAEESPAAASAQVPAAAEQQQGEPSGPTSGNVLQLWRYSEPAVQLLPEQNHGMLRGGSYPFIYDPVYGLPIVREVATYGELLRDIREGHVDQILWFPDPEAVDRFFMDGRCLVRYHDGSVKQSVIPPTDFRIPYAMESHGVKGIKIPAEPRHVMPFVQADPGEGQDFGYWDNYQSPLGQRRGPPVGPSDWALLRLGDDVHKTSYVDSMREAIMKLDPTAKLQQYVDNIKAAREKTAKSLSSVGGGSVWVSAGPWIGSAAILIFTLALRFQRGDLVDRINIYYYQDTEKKVKALKEARLAFLEEELPSLVASGSTMEDCQKRATNLNKRLGEKLEISTVEVERTFQACKMLLQSGDLEPVSAESVEAKLDSDQYMERIKAMRDGGEQEQTEEETLVDFGKFNTARIRKATDPKILDVKKKLREARRKLKATSKVQITDEIVFFDDVAGNEQAKLELMEVVDFFRKPGRYKRVGAKVPKGVLLIGPPGNGKTLMARAVAGEAGVSFVSCSASEFIEMYMGLGAARVRDLFQQARTLAPCIIFIDELDAVGRQRGGGEDSNQERDMTVNQLLSELDGFESENTGIVILAATNRLDVLDSALTRPGRFDRKVEVRKPDYAGRLAALRVHLRDKPIVGAINYEEMAFQTAGMSGAGLAGLCNTAAFIASREGREGITQADLQAALDQDQAGFSKKTYSPERRERYAVMEASICLVATLLPAIEPVKVVTIIPDIRAQTGQTVLWTNYERARTNQWTKRYLGEQMVLMMASRAAEELTYGLDGLSSLNQRRLHAARQIATKMMDSGFSDNPAFQNIRSLGSQYYSWENTHQMITVSGDWHMSRSEHIDVDMEMEQRLNAAYEQAKAIVKRNMDAFHALRDALLAQDTLQGEEVRAIVEKHANPEDLAARLAEKGKFL